MATVTIDSAIVLHACNLKAWKLNELYKKAREEEILEIMKEPRKRWIFGKAFFLERDRAEIEWAKGIRIDNWYFGSHWSVRNFESKISDVNKIRQTAELADFITLTSNEVKFLGIKP